jgi:regulator of protease activity HflC (stomatin/prohibitin superfamily)
MLDEILYVLYGWFGIIFVVLLIIIHSVRGCREWERAVILRLRRFSGIKGPGLFLRIPFIDEIIRVELRVITLDVPSQEVITKDNIPIKVDAVLYFKISDPAKAVMVVENYMVATSQNAQTSLRGVVGSSTLDELLGETEMVDRRLHDIIDKATDPWGVKVDRVEIKHVEIPENMQRAIAKQAEAERLRRAKIILAEGEYQAAQKLKQASDILGADPIVLRYLQTLGDAAKEPNTTILFPIEMLGALRKIREE